MGPWLRLMRWPAVCTALADILASYLYVWPSLRPWPLFATVAASSCAIYLGGMVLNDIVDREIDRHERPSRPIPSGAVNLRDARFLAVTFFVAGLALACLTLLLQPGSEPPWRSVGIAAALAAMAISYNVLWKRTWGGPLAMGTCRGLNWCLGMSTGVAATSVTSFWGLDRSQWLIVGGYGCYIAGITWFARTEAAVSPRGQLVWGLAWIVGGLILLSLFPFQGEFAAGMRHVTFAVPFVWPPLLFLLMLPVLRRCLVAVIRPEPPCVQSAVQLAIQSTILINAAICLAVRAPIWWSIGIVVLYLPTTIFRQRIMIT